MEFSKKITGLLSSLFGKREFSDIEIILKDGNKIPGHKLILYVRNNSWGLDDFIQADNLDLSMFPVSIVMTMLKWVYTDLVDIDGVSINFLTQLISIAKCFNLQSLYTRCETALNSLQDVEQYEIVNLNISNFQNKEDIVLKSLEGNPQSVSLDADVIGTKSVVITETPFSMDTVVDTSAVTVDTVVKKLQVTMDTVVVGDEDEATDSDSVLEGMVSEMDESDEDFTVDNITGRSAFNRFMCSICGKAFQHKGHLADHVTTHTGVKAFNCDVCGKSFNRRSSLLRHQNIHTNGKSYFCDICEKSFVDGSSLKRHKKIHLNIKNYVCKICSRKFTDASNFSRHMKGHNGVKSYPCLECNLKFRDASTLNRHLMTHENERNFCCHLCNSGFPRLTQLEKHLVTCEKSQE